MSIHPFEPPGGRGKRKAARAESRGRDFGITRSGAHSNTRLDDDSARSVLREIWPEDEPLRPSVAAILEPVFSEDLMFRTVAQLRASGNLSETALVTILFGRTGEAAISLNRVGEFGDYQHA